MSKLKLPEKLWYVIKDKKSSPLAYLTYYEDNEPFAKRKKTGLDWANGTRYSYGVKPLVHQDGIIIDNDPVTGMELLQTVERYSTSNKLFRVLDPRGFAVEIAVDLIFELMMDTDIKKGGIIDVPCVWVFDGTRLRPVVHGSEVYEEAKNIIVQSKIPESFVSYRNLSFGDTVKIKNESGEFIYGGRCKLSYKLDVESRQSYDYWNRCDVAGKKGTLHYNDHDEYRQVFYKKAGISKYKAYVYSSNPKITEIVSSNSDFDITKDDLVQGVMLSKSLNDSIRMYCYERFSQYTYSTLITIESIDRKV